MEILFYINFYIGCFFTGWYFVESLMMIFDDDYDKKGMLMALGKFIVAVMAVTVLYSAIEFMFK